MFAGAHDALLQILAVLGDESCIIVTFHEIGSVHDGTQIADVVFHTGQLIFVEYAAHPLDSVFAVGSPYNQFTDHRVVVDWNFVSLVHITVDTYTDTVRLCNLFDDTGARHEIHFCIFGTNTTLNSVSTLLDIFLFQLKHLSVGNFNLLFHQIYPNHFFRNRMLHL